MSMSASGSTSDKSEDARLDRLLDYTKFHIGIYISIGGGTVALIAGTAGSGGDIEAFLKDVIGFRLFLAAALVCMFLAGLCGGVIAASCASAATFKEVWSDTIGIESWQKFRSSGENWAKREHRFFWAGIIFLCLSVLTAPRVYRWLFYLSG